jgi:hypothetical protein
MHKVRCSEIETSANTAAPRCHLTDAPCSIPHDFPLPLSCTFIPFNWSSPELLSPLTSHSLRPLVTSALLSLRASSLLYGLLVHPFPSLPCLPSLGPACMCHLPSLVLCADPTFPSPPHVPVRPPVFLPASFFSLSVSDVLGPSTSPFYTLQSRLRQDHPYG